MTNLPPLIDRGRGPEVVHGALVQLHPGVARVTAPNASMMTGPGTNTYLVGTDRVIVIDPGPNLDEHLAALVSAIDSRPVDLICVTHTHPDHAPGAAPLAALVHAPLGGFGPGPFFAPDRLLVDGERLHTGAFSLEVLATPGHASDHLCYLLHEEGLCFTGDHVMHGSTVVIRPPDGDLAAYLASLAYLSKKKPKVLAPAHGRLIDDAAGAIQEVIAHRKARETRIAEALLQAGRASAAELLGIVYTGLDEQRTEIATVTLLAHLQHLEDQGLVSSSIDRPSQSLTTTFESIDQ